jgi:cytidylate kinase
MCASKRIVLAIYGLSCTGKSTIAAKLAALLRVPLRSASVEIRRRASELGVTPNALPMREHKAIDEATRSLATEAIPGMVIEGTFLDALLSDISGIVRIELKCADEERLRRLLGREGSRDLDSRDNDTQNLRSILHGKKTSLPDFSIDTTGKTADTATEEITTWLRMTNSDGKRD